MNILNPSALYLLLLIPPVVILYFMKLRRKRFMVTASFLWDKVMQEARVDSFFQKLKVNILLILQILFILFIIAALIRPYFQSLGSLSSETIFIIDTSASMKVKENGKSRFQLAKDKINELIKEARSGSSFMLIGVSDEAEILSGFTTDKTKIKNILDRLKLTDTGTDIKPAALLAISLLKSHSEARVFLIGDKMPKDRELNLEEIPAFNFIPIGSVKSNVAITSFDISRASPNSPAQMFVRVDNFSQEPVETFLEISFNDVLREARDVKLAPNKGKGFIFTIPVSFSGMVRAQIQSEDKFTTDNTVQAYAGKPEKIKILLVSNDNPFLNKILTLLPGVTVDLTDDKNVEIKDIDNYKITIWNNSKVPKVTRGNHIFINCDFIDKNLDSKGTIKYPAIISWEKEHPLFRFLDLSDVSILESENVKAPPGSRIMIQGDKAPLMILREKGSFRGIYVLFDLIKSDWQLLPSFPIFIANAVNYLGEQGGLSGIENHKTGEVLQLDFITDNNFEIKDPSNNKVHEFSKAGNSPSVPLKYAGIYTVKTQKGTFSFPVNLVNRSESMIEPDPPMEIKTTKTAGGRTFSLIREVWWEIALIALLLIIMEWYIFNKRRV